MNGGNPTPSRVPAPAIIPPAAKTPVQPGVQPSTHKCNDELDVLVRARYPVI